MMFCTREIQMWRSIKSFLTREVLLDIVLSLLAGVIIVAIIALILHA